MESWKRVWQEGVAPLLPTRGLEALRKALQEDSPELLQGATTSPPPLMCVADWPIEGACLIGLCGWKDGRKTVAEVEEFFAKACYDCDTAMCETAAVRWLLNWFDETPRAEMIRLLLPEVEAELERRGRAHATANF